MRIEQWKDIKGYDGYYRISDLGNVLSMDRVNEYGIHIKSRIMKQVVDKYGYRRVYLTKHCKTKSYLVHRLVADAFISNPNNYPEVNHKDENKQNNDVLNLEWCTHQYNSSYGTRPARIITKVIAKTRTSVEQCDDDGNVIKVWDSMNNASRVLNIHQQNISKCCQGVRQHAGGYVWRYAKEGDSGCVS